MTLGDKRWARVWTGEGKVKEKKGHTWWQRQVLESCHIPRILRKVKPIGSTKGSTLILCNYDATNFTHQENLKCLKWS